MSIKMLLIKIDGLKVLLNLKQNRTVDRFKW